jgi:hypothetical protein
MLLKVAIELCPIETEFLGVLMQIGVCQAPLMFVEVIMHLPETALRCRRLGRFRGVLGVRV